MLKCKLTRRKYPKRGDLGIHDNYGLGGLELMNGRWQMLDASLEGIVVRVANDDVHVAGILIN
jgi:hypothetical protein